MSSKSDDVSVGAVVVVGGFILAVVLAFFVYVFCFVTIDKGEVGVLSWFGQVEDQTLSPGAHLVNPFKKVQRTNVQVQKNDEPATVPTKGGLSVEMHAILLYHLDPAKAPAVVRDVGPDYEAKLVDPYFRNAVRDVCAEYDPEALYTAERNKVEGGVLARVTKELGERGFVVEAVMLQDPKLPQVVADRIQAKVAAEQDAIRMQSVFKQREQEALANKRQMELAAEAKVIEAQGIAEAQDIIKKGLDSNYLVYQFIEGLKDVAKHGNAIVYVPVGGDGLPVFKSVEPAKKSK